jgi:hypothetical protein
MLLRWHAVLLLRCMPGAVGAGADIECVGCCARSGLFSSPSASYIGGAPEASTDADVASSLPPQCWQNLPLPMVEAPHEPQNAMIGESHLIECVATGRSPKKVVKTHMHH